MRVCWVCGEGVWVYGEGVWVYGESVVRVCGESVGTIVCLEVLYVWLLSMTCLLHCRAS